MRQIKLAAVVVLSVLALASHAQQPVKEVRRGEFTISFTERSPLSARKVFARRFGWLERGYDLSRESFEVYVPADYQPNGSYGLFVWISAFPHGTIPEAYKPILDKYRLIWIGANHSGNKRVPFWHRFGLAIDAAHNMKKRYTLDLKRVYVGGYSGGGRCASVVAVGFPEHFHGGFYIVGCNYFRMLEVMRQPGSQWSFFQMPHRGILQTVMRRNRYVLLTGEQDFNREATEVIADAYRSDGFNHVTYIEIPGMGHLLPGAGWFERGIAFLDDPSLEVSTNSNDLRAEKERSTQDAETKLDLSPGLEVFLEAELRFEVPKPLKKTFLVYVPTDYTPERS